MRSGEVPMYTHCLRSHWGLNPNEARALPALEAFSSGMSRKRPSSVGSHAA